jgi:hypothetical protein
MVSFKLQATKALGTAYSISRTPSLHSSTTLDIMNIYSQVPKELGRNQTLLIINTVHTMYYVRIYVAFTKPTLNTPPFVHKSHSVGLVLQCISALIRAIFSKCRLNHQPSTRPVVLLYEEFTLLKIKITNLSQRVSLALQASI